MFLLLLFTRKNIFEMCVIVLCRADHDDNNLLAIIILCLCYRRTG